jgi:hypothetical protein
MDTFKAGSRKGIGLLAAAVDFDSTRKTGLQPAATRCKLAT